MKPDDQDNEPSTPQLVCSSLLVAAACIGAGALVFAFLWFMARIFA